MIYAIGSDHEESLNNYMEEILFLIVLQ